MINEKASIGENVTIFQGVTIGSMRGKGAPTIGNNVVIAAGAAIIGKVKVGNNCFIGANAVVVKDVPDGAVVVGNPAKIINFNGAHNVSLYNKTFS